MFNKAAHCKVLKIITKVRYISKNHNGKKKTYLDHGNRTNILVTPDKYAFLKGHLVSIMVGTISHTGFHHKLCTGIAVNVLCSDNTVCNCLHMTKYVRDMT